MFQALRVIMLWHACMYVLGMHAPRHFSAHRLSFVGRAGHVAGGMAGIYLGWGMGPKLKAVSHNSSQAAANSEADIMQSLDDFERPSAQDKDKSVPKELDAVDVISGVRRISVSVSLLTGLSAVTALKIIERAGHLSLPKGLGL